MLEKVLDEQISYIVPVIDSPCNKSTLHIKYYQNLIHESISRILPFNSTLVGADKKELFNELCQNMPILHWLDCNKTPCNSSFFLLYKNIPNTCKFFFDMISSWLIPNKRLTPILFFAADFMIPKFNNEIYSICEIVLRIENEKDLSRIKENYDSIAKEIELGASSQHQARHILEVKGLSADNKTTFIQERINHFMRKKPADFAHNDLWVEMQYFLVTCTEDFKQQRSSYHIARIIFSHYLSRQKLLSEIKNNPQKRYINIKIHKETLSLPCGKKHVLSILIGINFLKKDEFFEKSHLARVIQRQISLVKPVKGSFLKHSINRESVRTFYIEIEKSNGGTFCFEDEKKIKRGLIKELQTGIKHFANPIFMPDNEEEIVRNILTLSKELKYPKDIPQVIISFDKQTNDNVVFLIVLVRITDEKSISLKDLFLQNKTTLKFIPDRVKFVGTLRKKYKKEANVFRVTLKKSKFLRLDNYLDLQKARQSVSQNLQKIIGLLRDFNGGMIEREFALFNSTKELLNQNKISFDEVFLEEFFYAIKPDMMRFGVLNPKQICDWFLVASNVIESKNFKITGYSHTVYEKDNHIFVINAMEDALFDENTKNLEKLIMSGSDFKKDIKRIKSKNDKFKIDSENIRFFFQERMKKINDKLTDHGVNCISSAFSVYDTHWLGFLYYCKDEEAKKYCKQIISKEMKHWVDVVNEKK